MVVGGRPGLLTTSWPANCVASGATKHTRSATLCEEREARGGCEEKKAEDFHRKIYIFGCCFCKITFPSLAATSYPAPYHILFLLLISPSSLSLPLPLSPPYLQSEMRETLPSRRPWVGTQEKGAATSAVHTHGDRPPFVSVMVVVYALPT